MKEMKFSSQICTTKEQSKQLLELGLKPETADMHITNMSAKGLNYVDNWQIGCVPFSDCKKFWKDIGLVIEGTDVKNSAWEVIPAWSLHRLMEISEFTGIAFLNLTNAYGVMVDRIDRMVYLKTLNKEYLNSREEQI